MTCFEKAPIGMAIAIALALQGCYTGPQYVPVQVASTPASFDASWQAARAAAYDEGVRITSEDRAAGTLSGDQGPFSVLITVATQADGSVHVGFTVTGPSSQDAGLQDRLARAYQRRMGR
jgi:hypothetical protein